MVERSRVPVPDGERNEEFGAIAVVEQSRAIVTDGERIEEFEVIVMVERSRPNVADESDSSLSFLLPNLTCLLRSSCFSFLCCGSLGLFGSAISQSIRSRMHSLQV